MRRKTILGLPVGTTHLGPGRTRTVSSFRVPEIGEVAFIAYDLRPVEAAPDKGALPLGGF
jgi:hypothetical protein